MKWLDFVYPPICQGCGHIGQWLCDFCLAKIEFCFNPLKLDPSLTALTSVQAIAQLQFPVQSLIKALKYQKYPAIGTWLGNWVLEVIQPPAVSFITWVPLHPEKLNWRGFNQSELIGRALAKQLNLPCGQLCQKLSHTPAQAQISEKSQRLTHLNHQFQLLPSLQTPNTNLWFQNQQILIIDDVVTTGATLNAVAIPLKEVGMTQIYGLAIAHGQ